MQAEELAAAERELDQIEARGPVLVVSPSGVLGLAAIVPDLVHRPSLSPKMPPGRILDPVPVRKHHGDRVVGMREVDNQDAEFSSEFHVRNPPSLVSEVEPYWSEVYVQRP
jgi:hypothetical protein